MGVIDTLKLGVDIGSTTVKVVVADRFQKTVFSQMRRGY